LTATEAADGSQFNGFQGCNDGGTNQCTFTLDAALTIEADWQ